MIEEVVQRLLESEIGLDHESIGASTLRAAVGARMKHRGVTDPEAYRALLELREEVIALVDEIVIPETWFFRDRAPFEMLADLAAAPERAAKGLRILSAPCSSGEEPYSIAMTLLDAGFPADRFRILGIDVSHPLIARARAGVYGAFSFRGGDTAYRSRHFRRVEGDDERWEISPLLRSAVSFARDNLLAPFRLAQEEPFDLVFCRNLLIYLTPLARRRALDAVAKVLAPGGRVVAGHAEALDAVDPRFAPAGPKGAFTFALREREKEVPLEREAGVAARPKAPPAAAKPVARPAPAPAPPVRKLRAAISGVAPPPAPEPPLLELAAEHADRGELAAAAALCETRLREAAGDAAAHHLLGVVRQAQGDAEAAERCFTRALYCDPERAETMLNLALLLERRGDAAGGERLRRRAARRKESA